MSGSHVASQLTRRENRYGYLDAVSSGWAEADLAKYIPRLLLATAKGLVLR